MGFIVEPAAEPGRDLAVGAESSVATAVGVVPGEREAPTRIGSSRDGRSDHDDPSAAVDRNRLADASRDRVARPPAVEAGRDLAALAEAPIEAAVRHVSR